MSAQVAEQIVPRELGLLVHHNVRQRVVENGHFGHIRRQVVLEVALVGVLAQQHVVALERGKVRLLGILEQRLILKYVLLAALQGTLVQAIVLNEVARVEHLIVHVVGARLQLAVAVVEARHLEREPVVATIAFLTSTTK